MIHSIKRISVFLAVFLLLLSWTPCPVSAAESIDQAHPVSLTFEYVHEGMPVEDVEFELYYVAEVMGLGSYSLAGDFQQYPVELEGLDAAGWRALAKTLTYYVQADQIASIDHDSTDSNGLLIFPTAEAAMYPGLYLAIAQPKAGETHTYYTEPVLVCLPGYDYAADAWLYDVSVRAKYTVEENPEIPSDETVERKVLKIWENDAEEIRPEEITVHLLKNGQIHDTVILNAENNWRYHWTDLAKYDDQGIAIEWGIVEDEIEDYTVHIATEGITFIITNTFTPEEDNETVRREVVKKWDDQGYADKRPEEIRVQLLRNGQVHDTQVLNDGNQWRYAWEELPARDSDGAEISWTVLEVAVEGYEGTVEQKGDTFILTNTIDVPSLPQTGMLWWPVPVLAAAGLLSFVIGVTLRGGKRDA